MSLPPDPITNRPPDDFERPAPDEIIDRPTRRREIDRDEDYPDDLDGGRFRRRDRLADRSTRLGAALLDGIFSLIAAAPGIAVMIFSQTATPGGGDDTLLAVGIGVTAVGVLALSIYQWVLLARQGQTIAKRLCSIRIVRNDDGRNPGFGMAVGLRVWVPGVISNVPYVGGCFSLLDVLFIFGDERRCLHDYIAQTKVVKVEPDDRDAGWGEDDLDAGWGDSAPETGVRESR